MISLWNTDAAAGSFSCMRVEGLARQPIDHARLLGDDARGARHLPEEAHLADHRIAHHAAKPDRPSLLVVDGDGDAARGQASPRESGGLALAEQRLADGNLVALQIRRDARHVGGAAELRREPALETMRRGLAHLVIHQQHVLAPFQRLVAAAEHLVRLAGGEESGLLEARPHRLRSSPRTRASPRARRNNCGA